MLNNPEMAAEGPLISEHAQGEFADGFNGANYHSFPLTCINRKPVERTINNNNVWGKSPTQEILPSSTQDLELRCYDFVDANRATFSTPSCHALNSGAELSEKHSATEEFTLEKSTPVESTESQPAKNTYERSTSAKENLVKESENFTASINTDALMQNEPLSLKERISNIDLSIEWIKCELALMRAQDFSLKEQFEQLFKELMEFKLRMEMEKDEEEQFIEEEIFFD